MNFMPNLILAISVTALFGNVVIYLTLRRYLKRIDRKIRGPIEASLHNVQELIRVLTFQNNAAVQSLVQDLRSGTASANLEPFGSIAQTIKNLNVSWLVESASDTVICTVALGTQYREGIRPCLDSHKAYAQQRGYRYAVLENYPHYHKRSSSWMKLPLILKLLQGGTKRVFYIDADAMITNTEISLEPYFEKLQNSADILITEDELGVNCGVMFVVNTTSARQILELMWLYDAEIDHPNWEQNALKVLLKSFHEARRRVLIEPRPKSFNSFPVERRMFHKTRDENIWAAGDFICHFSGIGSPDLKRLVQDYAQRQANSVAAIKMH